MIVNLVSTIQGKKQISDSVGRVLKTREENNIETNEQLSEIVMHLHLVQEIAETINSISEQTNLLSMNTSIESAHAGDEGKGFAVVTDEIKKLADSSRNNSLETGNFVLKIDGTIHQTSGTSSRNIDSFENIIFEVKKLSSVFDTIAMALDEVLSSSYDIQGATSSLFNISENSRENFHSMTSGSEHINDTLHNIDDISRNLLDEIKDINSRAARLQEVMQHVNNTQKKNKEQTDKIITKLNRFHTE